MNNTRKILVFDRIVNDVAAKIPYDFDGDIIANEVICNELKIKGNIYAKNTICVMGDLVAEAVYSDLRICCYGTIKAQDIACKGPVIAGSGIIASGDIDCIGLDTGSIDVYGDVTCAGIMRIDKQVKVNGKLISI